MSAPGYYILCPKGHEIGVIENGLYWDDKLFKELKELENKKCPICGQKAKYKFCHYGSIDDCVDVELTWDSIEKRWIIPRELSERQKEDLKNCTIKRGKNISVKKAKIPDATVFLNTDITGVRIRELKKDGNILAKYPRNEGSGITIEGDCAVEIEINGSWNKIWELRISSKYVRCDMTNCECD